MQLRRFRFRRGLMRASRVIAVSEATKRDVENHVGVPPDRIRRVYNAPDPAFFHARHPAAAEERQRILERYQIHYPFLLYAGNIRRHKNIPRLVEAFAVVREQLATHPVYHDLRLVIIGDKISQHPAVRQAVIKSRVENVVRFLGFVPFETLRCFYETAAAFVFPSRYEGFGLPPLEAMACGTPVVTSNVSSLPEVVGDAAILVNPENVFDIARGIRDVLLDEELRAYLIRGGPRAGGALQLGVDGAKRCWKFIRKRPSGGNPARLAASYSRAISAARATAPASPAPARTPPSAPSDRAPSPGRYTCPAAASRATC